MNTKKKYNTVVELLIKYFIHHLMDLPHFGNMSIVEKYHITLAMQLS